MASQGPTCSDDAVEFRRRMNATVASGTVMLGLGLGVELGLFKILCDEDQPLTAAQMANKADCNQRFLEEWLKQMVAADVVQTDECCTVFHLASERRGVFQTIGGSVTSGALLVSHLAQHRERLLRCFKTGDCKDTSSYWPVTDIMRSNEERKEVYFPVFLREILLPKCDWLEPMLDTGIRLLDVGCGRGKVPLFLAKLYPRSQFVGVDISEPVIQEARALATSRGVNNTVFQPISVPGLPADWEGTYDIITMIDVLHDMSRATEALKDCRRVLKNGGRIVILDFAFHSDLRKNCEDPVLRENLQIMAYVSMNYCLQFSMSAEGAEGLGSTIGLETLIEKMDSAGFREIHSVIFQKKEYVKECILVASK